MEREYSSESLSSPFISLMVQEKEKKLRLKYCNSNGKYYKDEMNIFIHEYVSDNDYLIVLEGVELNSDESVTPKDFKLSLNMIDIFTMKSIYSVDSNMMYPIILLYPAPTTLQIETRMNTIKVTKSYSEHIEKILIVSNSGSLHFFEIFDVKTKKTLKKKVRNHYIP